MGIATPILNVAAFTLGNYCFHGVSHPGLCRKSNEDRLLIKDLEGDGVMLAVADGLGDEPSASAAEMVREKLAGIDTIAQHREIPELVRITRRLDCTVHDRKKDPGADESLGSTLLAVLIRSGKAHWVHVGDSRLYLFRNGTLRQITQDQTLARFLVSEKHITPEQSQTHYSRCVMDQYVGCGYAEPETGTLQILDHDCVILSTDGLHKLIGHNEFASILNTSADIGTKAEKLVRAALDAGGTDNITVVLMQS